MGWWCLRPISLACHKLTRIRPHTFLSVGIVTYVALGGVFPFDAQRPVLDQVLRGEFFFPDAQFGECSDHAIDLICNLLVVNPLERFQCDDCLRHVWLREEGVVSAALDASVKEEHGGAVMSDAAEK